MEIERLTGAPAGAVMPSALVIEAIPGEPGSYELRLSIGDELRVLRDPDCRILWRSAIVIVAAAARSEAAPAAPPPASEPPPSQPPSAAASAAPAVPPPPPASTARQPAPRAVAPLPRERAPAVRPRPIRRRAPRPRPPPPAPEARAPRSADRAAPASTPLVAPAFGELRGGFGLGVGVSGGVLPDLGGVLDAGGRLELLPWAVDASVRYWPERSQSREGRAVDITGLGLRVAALFRVADALNLFAGIEVNRLVGEGAEGVSGRNSAAVWQLAPTAGINLITWDIGSLRLELSAAARLSLARPRFVVTGYGDLYRVPPLGGDAIIRGVWLFP